MNADAEALYRDFVAAELHPLLRTAYLLCGSWHTAEDLVQTTFVALYRAWPRLSLLAELTSTAELLRVADGVRW